MHRLAVVAAVVPLLLTVPASARADLLQDLGATYELVAQELSTAFPKVESRIVAVQGAEVRLEGPGLAALRPGLELTAYRKGAPFRHPVTNQILGHAEEEVAILVVTGVAGDQATARVAVTEGGRTPTVGDGARITAGRIAVAVPPTAGVQVPGETAQETALLLVSRFSALLEKTGRFLAVEPRRVLEAARPAGTAPAPSPLEVAQRLQAPAVLTSRVFQEGRTRYLETAWISGRTGAIVLTGRKLLVRAVYPPRFAWEQTPELERRHPLEGPVRGLALADLDGDGRPELVAGDERAITVYRWQDGVGPVPVAGAEFRPGGQILSVDAADVNKAGRAQVVVVDYLGAAIVRSTVLELAGDRLRPIYETGGRYLRVIPVGSEPWLVEQPVGQTEPFAPPVRRLVWEGGRYREGAILRAPSGVSVYGLALMRLTGSAQPEIVALTPEDRLAVWTAQGRRLWTSADALGGAAITFPFTPVEGRRDADALIGRILGRVVALPDAPEGPDLLVFENLLPVGGQFRTLLPRLAATAFTAGRVHRFRWKDGGFVRVWQSRPTEGYIADFAYGDLDGNGIPDVVVGVVPRGFGLDTLNPFGRPRAHLIFYELP
ncbi:MAG: VCBS repeat-containing protein [Candidatus Rokubacteria bacterium]|nr:VCBS repeat-containing protein [Candidatus Rokubacteria bacterium]